MAWLPLTLWRTQADRKGEPVHPVAGNVGITLFQHALAIRAVSPALLQACFGYQKCWATGAVIETRLMSFQIGQARRTQLHFGKHQLYWNRRSPMPLGGQPDIFQRHTGGDTLA